MIEIGDIVVGTKDNDDNIATGVYSRMRVIDLDGLDLVVQVIDHKLNEDYIGEIHTVDKYDVIFEADDDEDDEFEPVHYKTINAKSKHSLSETTTNEVKLMPVKGNSGISSTSVFIMKAKGLI